MKNRIIQPFIMLGLLITIIVYCIVMIIIWPIFFIGAYCWEKSTFWDMMDSFYKHIPSIQEY